jgi:chromosome segregation ATPase
MITSIDDKVQEIQFVEASSGYGQGRDYFVHSPDSNQSQHNNAGHYVSRDDFESLRALAEDERDQCQRAEKRVEYWQDRSRESHKIIQSLQNQLGNVATAKDRASERFAAENMEAREWKERATEWREAHETLFAEREKYRQLLRDVVSDKKKAEEALGIVQFRRIADAQWSGADYVRASDIQRLLDIEESAKQIKRLLGMMDFNYQRGRMGRVAKILPEACDLAKKMDV